MHVLSPPSVQSTAQDAPFLNRETFSAACVNVPVLLFFLVTHFHVCVYTTGTRADAVTRLENNRDNNSN